MKYPTCISSLSAHNVAIEFFYSLLSAHQKASVFVSDYPFHVTTSNICWKESNDFRGYICEPGLPIAGLKNQVSPAGTKTY